MFRSHVLASGQSVMVFSFGMLVACGSNDHVSRSPDRPVREVFTVDEPDLFAENVAYDATTESYFLGSTRKGKILRIQNGQVTEFKGGREDGLWMVVGMKVDSQRRWLWVCSSNGENLLGWDSSQAQNRAAGLFRYDLDSGDLLDRWLLEEPGVPHFLNDLVVASDGSVYVTHMFGRPAIYRAAPNGDFALHTQLPEDWYPNGITLSLDQTTLYVAGSAGVLRVGVSDHSVVPFDTAPGVSALGLDGLYRSPGGLVGILPETNAVMFYRVNAAWTAITESVPLRVDRAELAWPTTGVVVGDELHFVANSQFNLVGDDGSIPPLTELSGTVVLSVPVGLRE